MKRWFISRVGDYDNEGTIVPKVNVYGCNSRIWTSSALPNWCFGQLASNRVADLQADPDIYVLPDGTMDMAVSAIPSNIRTTLRTRLEAAGLSFADVKLTWTIRQLLNYVAGQIQPSTNVEAGDVPDQE
jgi:hypothetical protein